MALDTLKLLEKVRSLGGSTVTHAQVKTELAKIDRNAVEAEEAARLRVEVWDKQTPLGGQPPEYWFNRGDLPPGGEVILLYEDGNLTTVQPHDPDSAGYMPMTAQQALEKGRGLAGRLVQGRVDERVAAIVMDKLVP